MRSGTPGRLLSGANSRHVERVRTEFGGRSIRFAATRGFRSSTNMLLATCLVVCARAFSTRLNCPGAAVSAATERSLFITQYMKPPRIEPSRDQRERGDGRLIGENEVSSDS